MVIIGIKRMLHSMKEGLGIFFIYRLENGEIYYGALFCFFVLFGSRVISAIDFRI